VLANCPKVNEESADGLFELVATFPTEEVRAHFSLLVPFLKTHTVDRLRLIVGAIGPSSDDWTVIAESIVGQSAGELERFSLQFLDYQVLRPVICRLLYQPGRPILAGLLDIVELAPIPESRVSVFINFVSSFLQKSLCGPVDRLCQKHLREVDDLSEQKFDLVGLFKFLASQGYVASLLDAVKGMYSQNKKFKEVLRDEIPVLSMRTSENPHIVISYHHTQHCVDCEVPRGRHQSVSESLFDPD
jgi:hypothetical protein